MKGIKFGLALMALIMMVGAAMAQSFDPNYFDQDFTFPTDATPSVTIPNSADDNEFPTLDEDSIPNSADDDEFPTFDENSIPDDDDFFPDVVTPPRGLSPPSPPSPKHAPSPTPKTPISPSLRVPPRFRPPTPRGLTRHSPCVRKCQSSCTSDKVMFRKACFEACPKKCDRHYRPREHGPKALKKCVLGCISAIPTPDTYTPTFVLEDNLNDQLKACYKTCSARIEIKF